jgi:hypothetical protein
MRCPRNRISDRPKVGLRPPCPVVAFENPKAEGLVMNFKPAGLTVLALVITGGLSSD